jgi:energy-coupling factor transporter ATP-binding protein EcfA2
MLDHAPSPQRLRALASSLDRLDLGVVGIAAEARRRRAVVACHDYLAPRLEDPSAPLVLLVAGPGGSGKSTIVNSLGNRRISETGPVRPTTLEPVAWTGEELPPTLDVARRRIPGSMVDSLRPPPRGTVIVDSPPPEVTDGDGRSIAHDLLAVADALVFVAGASRYADADGFGLLEEAAARGLPVITVLNRLPADPEIQLALASDFAVKLVDRRLVPRPDPELVVTVAESIVSPETDGLTVEEVGRVRKEIEAMADPQSRPEIVTAAVTGTLRRLRTDLAVVRAALIDREVRRVELLDPMRAIYREEGRRLVAEVKGGALAGLAEPLGAVASAAARRAGLAARTTAEAWADIALDLVDASPSLFGHGPDVVDSARERLEFWEGEVEPLIERLATRRVSGRRRRALASYIRRAAFDPRTPATRRIERLLERVPGVVDGARDLLAEELRGIVDADSRRFEDAVGPSTPDGILAELTEVSASE